MTSTQPPGRREAKKAATRRTLIDVAMALFAQQGYHATTVEQVAAAAGVSHMTFFRYFPSKDHLVLTPEYDPLLVQHLTDRPDEEPAVEMVRAAVLASLEAIYPARRDELLQRWTLVAATPELLALQAQRTATTQSLVAEGLGAHPGHEAASLRTRVIAAACLAAATTASLTWAQHSGQASLLDLTNDAFDTLASMHAPPAGHGP